MTLKIETYETRLVSDHLSNDEATYLEVNGLARDAWLSAEGAAPADKQFDYLSIFRDRLEEFVMGEDGRDMFGISALTETGGTLVNDLLTSALARVEFWDVARNWVDDPEAEYGEDTEDAE